MFEHSLIELEARPQARRRRWISLPVAVGLHAVGLTAFAFASYWNVAEVPEPDLNVVYFNLAPLPELPGGGGGGAPRQPERPPEPPVETPPAPRQPVQPTAESVPAELPAPAAGSPVDEVLGGEDPAAHDGPGTGECPACPVGPGVGPGPSGPGTGPGGGGEPAELAPIQVTVGMTKPEPIHRVQPRYTESARRVGVEGTVIVEAIIDEQGDVRNARVLRGLPLGLDREAVDAILQWKFRPAMLNGRPVKVYFTLSATFTIQR